MCLEWPCMFCMVGLALVVGYFVGQGNDVHVSDIPRTLEEEMRWCPGIVPPVVSFVADRSMKAYQSFAVRTYGEAGDFAFHPGWAGSYFASFYLSAVHVVMGSYKARHADSLDLPTKMGETPTFRIGHVVAPDMDVDDPYFLPAEKFIPRWAYNKMFLPGFNCYMGSLRLFEFEDLLDADNNTWGPMLQNGKYARKRDWVMTFYQPYKMADGVPVYPTEENDLGAYFWKADQWDDGLEKAMAFDLIGAHRLRAVTDRSVGGETIAFVLPMNHFAAADVRPLFGRYGVNMYFSADGLPILLETTDGREVQRGDKDWQYWKFVWRSTLVSSITLVDHLHLTHFRAANILARVTRKTLPPDHVMRRLLSVFTFGTVYINNNAMHTLLGTNHVLHRSTPFKEFESLSDLVPANMPSLGVWHGAMLNDTEFQALPAMIRETPYYADGRLLVGALRRLMHGILDLRTKESCDENGMVRDAAMTKCRNALMAMDAEAGYASSVQGALKCQELRDELLAFIWTVTGWHRHVGTVGDYYKDPDLAGFGWKEGEPFVRPRQCMLMSVVAAFTSMPQPKLSEDYTHMFKGISQEAEVVALWQKFREELQDISATVKKRNEARRVKNPHADPELVECSVAV